MSSARITYIGLTGYPMIHPVINRINPNPVKFRMDDRISGLIGFGAHLYSIPIDWLGHCGTRTFRHCPELSGTILYWSNVVPYHH